MAGIPLPALAIHGPNPNETENAFSDVIKLRLAQQAQAAQQQNDAQRNSILQQDANTQAQAQQFKLQQLRLAQQNAALQNQAWQNATKNGAFDEDEFTKSLTGNGYTGDIVTASKDAQAVYAAKQAAEAAQGKQGQAYVDHAMSLMQSAAKITDPALATRTFLSGLQTMGDKKDLAYFSSLSQQQLYSVIQSQGQPNAMNEQQLAMLANEKGPDGQPTPQAQQAQAALAQLQNQKIFSKSPMSGTINGKQAYAYATPNGFVSSDASHTPISNFVPAPNYGQFLMTFSNPNSPTTQSAAKMIADYQMAPPSGYALARPEGQALMAAVKQINPDYNANGFGLAHELISGKDGRNIGNLNTAIKHMNALDQVANALGNQNIQARNRVVNWAATQLGGAPPVSFDALKSAVASEIASALKGNATDQEIANAEGFINRANSPAQMHSALKDTMKIMAQKLGTYQERIDGATAGRAGMVPVLMPQSKAVLSQWGVSTADTGLKQAPGPGPDKGATRQYLGATYKFDGTEWVKQ
ncbi:MAG: hypothetical protein KGL39_14205 [Patescibacteria group bacterium]|nr:hypothetical protein [Patescibacteria group bacterium]